MIFQSAGRVLDGLHRKFDKREIFLYNLKLLRTKYTVKEAMQMEEIYFFKNYKLTSSAYLLARWMCLHQILP